MEKMSKMELEMLDDLIAYEREIYILKLKIKELEYKCKGLEYKIEGERKK